MYRLIVARKVRHAWGQLQDRNTDAVLAQFADRFEHVFAGEHALGGVRNRRDSQQAWFARLFRLLPDVRFKPRDVLVKGYPWRTRAVAIIDVTLGDDAGYRTVVFQQLDLRWGKITRLENLEDTQALAELLRKRGSTSPEALAAPIVDRRPSG